MAVRTVNRKKITLAINALTAVPISATSVWVPDFEVYFPTGNTGTLAYVGDSTVDNTWIPRAKSTSYNFVSGTGSMDSNNPELGFDLSKIYIQGSNAGDSAIIEYMKFVN